MPYNDLASMGATRGMGRALQRRNSSLAAMASQPTMGNLFNPFMASMMLPGVGSYGMGGGSFIPTMNMVNSGLAGYGGMGSYNPYASSPMAQMALQQLMQPTQIGLATMAPTLGGLGYNPFGMQNLKNQIGELSGYAGVKPYTPR